MPYVNRWWDKEKDGPIEPAAYSISEWVDYPCPNREQVEECLSGPEITMNHIEFTDEGDGWVRVTGFLRMSDEDMQKLLEDNAD